MNRIPEGSPAGFSSRFSRPVRIGILVGICAASPFALYLGIVFGTLAAAIAIRAIGTALGAPAGILLSLLLVGGALLAMGAAIGGLIAWTLERIVSG